MATTRTPDCPCGAPPGVRCHGAFCVNYSLPAKALAAHVSPNGSLAGRTFAAPQEAADPPILCEGAVVRLKTGGPKMTVVDVRLDGVADVIWFLGSEEAGWGSLQRHSWPVGAFDLVVS